MSDSKGLVKKQFAANAEKYVLSEVHAKGDSLALLIEFVNPRPDWMVLDIATGGGHNAIEFAKYAGSVLAGDLTYRIVDVARSHIRESTGASIETMQFDAEALPVANNTVDCVTSRIAPHHFPNIQQFLTESVRILKPGGALAIADNVSPDNEMLADYLNAFERLRDPSHHWAFSIHDWKQLVDAVGLIETRIEVLSKDLDFLDWTRRTNVNATTVVKLESMLRQAPADLYEMLNPREMNGRLNFSLVEAVIVAKKASG